MVLVHEHADADVEADPEAWVRDGQQPVLLLDPFHRAARMRVMVDRHPVGLRVLDERVGDVREPPQVVIGRVAPEDPVPADEHVRLAAQLGTEVDHPLLELQLPRSSCIVDLDHAQHRDRRQADPLQHPPDT